MTELHKPTSAYYGEEYQSAMVGYYQQAKIADTYEHRRVQLGDRLVRDHVSLHFPEKSSAEITVVDVGCSVGTFAIHFSKQGYTSFGIDFDQAAIKLAEKLNAQDGASARFLRMDVAALKNEIGTVDVAVCMDLFEHLHDDEIGALLYSLKTMLSPNGCVVFHTLPLQFDYLFWKSRQGRIAFPVLLRPFKRLRPSVFSRMVRIYALLFDIAMVCRFGKTYAQYIKRFDHCNPLTQERLSDIFDRAGYELRVFESGFIADQFRVKDKKFFDAQPITHRSLYGVAVPRKPAPGAN